MSSAVTRLILAFVILSACGDDDPPLGDAAVASDAGTILEQQVERACAAACERVATCFGTTDFETCSGQCIPALGGLAQIDGGGVCEPSVTEVNVCIATIESTSCFGLLAAVQNQEFPEECLLCDVGSLLDGGFAEDAGVASDAATREGEDAATRDAASDAADSGTAPDAGDGTGDSGGPAPPR